MNTGGEKDRDVKRWLNHIWESGGSQEEPGKSRRTQILATIPYPTCTTVVATILLYSIGLFGRFGYH